MKLSVTSKMSYFKDKMRQIRFRIGFWAGGGATSKGRMRRKKR